MANYGGPPPVLGVRSSTFQSSTPRHRPSAPVLAYWALGQWSAQMPNTAKSPGRDCETRRAWNALGSMGSWVLPRGTRPPVTREARGIASTTSKK
jgi:hypothetical protein